MSLVSELWMHCQSASSSSSSDLAPQKRLHTVDVVVGVVDVVVVVGVVVVVLVL